MFKISKFDIDFMGVKEGLSIRDEYWRRLQGLQNQVCMTRGVLLCRDLSPPPEGLSLEIPSLCRATRLV